MRSTRAPRRNRLCRRGRQRSSWDHTCHVQWFVVHFKYPLFSFIMAETLHWADPGFCNTNLNMVHVSIDMSRPENQSLKPELEESEFIECFTVPLSRLYDECKR